MASPVFWNIHRCDMHVETPPGAIRIESHNGALHCIRQNNRDLGKLDTFVCGIGSSCIVITNNTVKLQL